MCFVAGVHGVGKTTLCRKAALAVGIPHFSASELIHSQDAAALGPSKLVRSPDHNQNLLLSTVNKLLQSHKRLLLDGHMSLLTCEGIAEVPLDVFKNLQLDALVVLWRDPGEILQFLQERDGQTPLTCEDIQAHQQIELEHGKRIASTLEVPFWSLKDPEPKHLEAAINSSRDKGRRADA